MRSMLKPMLEVLQNRVACGTLAGLESWTEIMITKYYVMWTGMVEVEAESHEEAVQKIKSDPDLVLRECKYGASDGVVSYSEPKK